MREVLHIPLAALCALALVGCVGDGAKITEGTDVSVGISLPGTEGEMSLTVFNYLSGFRIGLEENSRIKLKYKVAETNDYLGTIHTRVQKEIEAEIVPTINEEEPEEDSGVDGKEPL